MNIGSIEKLKIGEIVDFGAYLLTNENEKVLLPKKQLKPYQTIGDVVEVFLYNDSKGRPIATIKKPLIKAGEIYRLKVVDVNSVGAFLDMGLERDLLLPFSEQLYKVKTNEYVEVVMYVDKSNRLCASMYLDKIKNAKKIDYKIIKEKQYIYNSEKVYKIIKEKFKGHLIYTDKTATVEDVKRDFNMSKKIFKDSIGKLYKDRKIKITEKGIFTYY